MPASNADYWFSWSDCFSGLEYVSEQLLVSSVTALHCCVIARVCGVGS